MRLRFFEKEYAKAWGIRPIQEALKEVEKEKEKVREIEALLTLRYGERFKRFAKWIEKTLFNLSDRMSAMERLTFYEEALQTFSAVMEEAGELGIDVDPIVLADLWDATGGDYHLIRQFFFAPKTEEEALLIWERLQRNFHRKGFTLGEMLIKDGDKNRDSWEDIAQIYLSNNSK